MAHNTFMVSASALKNNRHEAKLQAAIDAQFGDGAVVLLGEYDQELTLLRYNVAILIDGVDKKDVEELMRRFEVAEDETEDAERLKQELLERAFAEARLGLVSRIERLETRITALETKGGKSNE